jgi:hypothetical protein
VAIPAFFLGEAVFAARGETTIRLMGEAAVVPRDERSRFDRAVGEARRSRDTWTVEIAVALLTGLFVWSGVRADLLGEAATWRTRGDGSLSLAGWWYALVSLPVFQFLLWRWYARILIWWRLLWRVSRLRLVLMPTHPDRAGGLGGFGVTQVALVPMSAGVSAMLAATYAEQVMYGGRTLDSVILPMLGFVVANTAVAIAPLLVFSAQLFDAKQRGLLEYGVLAEAYTRAFDAKWIHADRQPDDPLLGSADVQSLADLANAYGVILSMRFVPLSPLQAVSLVAAATFPALPLALLAVPLEQLVVDVLRMLIGL